MDHIEVITDAVRFTSAKDEPEIVRVILSAEPNGQVGIKVSGESLLIVDASAIRELVA
jgi:hypothetical protein